MVPNVEETTATLTWTRPNKNFECIEEYVVEWESLDDNVESDGSETVSAGEIAHTIGNYDLSTFLV